MHIPKIVHQTWKNKFPHPALRACIESFQFMNPGWEVRYYTDADCLAWMEKNCPQLIAAYQSFPTGIHRADLFRILALYYEGGVYADIDVECIRPLDELLARLDASKSIYLTRDHPVHEHIHFQRRPMYMNDFMIAKPGDPLLEEIIKWMLACPPLSSSSAEAVTETGPGVVSSVVEMLGGTALIPSLQEMPTPWIHPLPDMNCKFDEKPFYQAAIASRDWLKRDVYVVHYWYHTWVSGVKVNTLVDHADVLLSTLGEQVERKLQWHLGNSSSAADNVIACALAEFAEVRGTVILYVDRESDPTMDRFLDLLTHAGLKPKLLMLTAPDAEGLHSRVTALKDRGASSIRPTQLSQVGANGWTSKVLLVASSGANLNLHGLQQYIRQAGGFVLGPPVEWAKDLAEAEGFTFSEVSSPDQWVPRIMHLLPDQLVFVPNLAERLAAYEFSIRQWTEEEVRQLLQDMSLGIWDTSLMPKAEAQFLASLSILYLHGGVVFQGDSVMLPEQLHRDLRTTFCHGQNQWLLACPPKSTAVAGALQHWQSASRKTGMIQRTKQFLEERMATIFRLGHMRDLHAAHLKAHPFLP